MIHYDSQLWRSFASSRGSVLPSAFRYAMPYTILAVVLKVLDNEGVLKISQWNLLKQTAAWTAFSGTVGFLLVFRASQCYNRFERCSTAVFKMRAEMREAVSSLFSFLVMSKASKEDQSQFKDKMIHLFSILHGCCLSSVSGQSHNRFKMIDVESLQAKWIHALQEVNGVDRVDLTYQWIMNCVVKEISTGLLNIPPPIMSRFFQEMENAMVEYNEIVQLMTIPFPFPYSQACLILMFIFMCATPFLTVAWTEQAVAAGVFTFLSASCFLSLEMISSELDNPFGDDDNDLPSEEIHERFNASLQLLLHPSFDAELTLNQHTKSAIVKATKTWHELDDRELLDLEAGHEDDFALDLEEEEEKGRQPATAEQPQKAEAMDAQKLPMETEIPDRAASDNVDLDDDALHILVDKVTHSYLQCNGPGHKFSQKRYDRNHDQAPRPPQTPSMTKFAQSQRQFEVDILKRLDEIVGVLTQAGFNHKHQTTEIIL